jgi:hypothetical protein
MHARGWIVGLYAGDQRKLALSCRFALDQVVASLLAQPRSRHVPEAQHFRCFSTACAAIRNALGVPAMAGAAACHWQQFGSVSCSAVASAVRQTNLTARQPDQLYRRLHLADCASFLMLTGASLAGAAAACTACPPPGGWVGGRVGGRVGAGLLLARA